MSINWVMLKEGGQGFVPLPREKILHASPSRTAIVIQTPNSYPGKEPFNVSCNAGGVAYITNQRMVYLPSTTSPDFQSLSAPILNMVDSRVSAPWFGANAWVAILKPVTGGGIPPQHAFVEVKLTFREGGAFDFHRIFEEVKERLSHSAETARANGRTADLSDVPLEPLPAYEASNIAGAAPPPNGAASVSSNPVPSLLVQEARVPRQSPAPQEPPPGYEEAQTAGVMDSLEESVRQQNS